MKHLLKTKRKKAPAPQPPQRCIWPVAFQAEPDGILSDEGGRMSPPIMFQNAMDVDQSPPSTPGFAIVDTGYEDPPTAEGTNDVGREIGPLVALRIEKRARKEKFGPLKVVLRDIPAIFANGAETITVEKRVANLLPRIAALEEYFDSRPDDVVDQEQRDALILKLNEIEEQLRSLSEKQELPRLNHVKIDDVKIDEHVFQLLEDLREAILDYQISRQTATHRRGLSMIDPAESAILNNVRSAQQAEYRHGNRNSCLKGTRTEILDGIELWTRDFDKPPIYWLNGLAGTGKSTIAQTIARRMFADGQLGASFFCSRDFKDRSNLQSIFPTLAVQLARRYAKFRPMFIPLVQADPEIIYESLYDQMKKLIVQPLTKSAISTVIVIDALDECEDDKPASAILSVLGQFVAEIPNVKFFITGRPESHILDGFQLPLLAKATDVFVLHEVEPGQVKNDIRLFLQHSFSELKHYRPGLGD